MGEIVPVLVFCLVRRSKVLRCNVRFFDHGQHKGWKITPINEEGLIAGLDEVLGLWFSTVVRGKLKSMTNGMLSE